MKQANSPLKNSKIGWSIMLVGAAIALIAAFIHKKYDATILFYVSLFLVLVGSGWQIFTVRCPHCGHSLCGYRPIPTECPKCHAKFEQED